MTVLENLYITLIDEVSACELFAVYIVLEVYDGINGQTVHCRQILSATPRTCPPCRMP